MITYDFSHTIYNKHYHHTWQYDTKYNNNNYNMFRMFTSYFLRWGIIRKMLDLRFQRQNRWFKLTSHDSSSHSNRQFIRLLHLRFAAIHVLSSQSYSSAVQATKKLIAMISRLSPANQRIQKLNLSSYRLKPTRQV